MNQMDSPVPADALLQHAAFVRSLARHLLRDPNDEDDAVQETWGTSLEHPPHAGGGTRAWLSKVMRNVVRQEWRGALGVRNESVRAPSANRSPLLMPSRATRSFSGLHPQCALSTSRIGPPLHFATTRTLRHVSSLFA